MKLYLLYLSTAVINSWIILFLFGISAGFANYFPVLALLGSILMFLLAAPISIHKTRLGLILGLISYLLVLPYILLFTKGILEDGLFDLVTVFTAMPLPLILLGIYYTVKLLRTKSAENLDIPSNRAVRLLLSFVPMALFVLYLILYGQYWSWESFKVL